MIDPLRFLVSVGWLLAICPFQTSTHTKGPASTKKDQACAEEVPGWERSVSRITTDYINPEEDTTVISSPEICETPDPETQQFPLVVVIVTSAPSNFSARSAIRESWANHTNKGANVGFIVGLTKNQSLQEAIEQESAAFNDIIQDRFSDSYLNLTLKSISMLKWFVHRCLNSTFLMKTDDDTYVDVKSLMSWLKIYRHEPPSSLLVGNLLTKKTPTLDCKHKHYAPKYTFKNQVYPDYLQGSAYLMSRDVAKLLYAAVLETPLFHLEDVYLTGICAATAGLEPLRAWAFQFHEHYNKARCLRDGVITCNPFPPSDLRWIWKQRESLRMLDIAKDDAKDTKNVTMAPTASSIWYTQEITHGQKPRRELIHHCSISFAPALPAHLGLIMALLALPSLCLQNYQSR